MPLTHPAITLSKSAAFADGTELRLTRFARLESAVRYLTMLRQAESATELALGARRGLRMSGQGIANEWLVYLEQHDRDLLEARGPDAARVLARLSAQHVPVVSAPPPPPVEQAMALPKPRPVWPFGVGFAVFHTLAFVVFVFWAGARTTRVYASPSATPASASTLEARLFCLPSTGAPCTATRGESGDLTFEYVFPAEVARVQRLTMRIDAHKRVVHVREQLGASGDAPRTAVEADMRTVGSVGLDPTRPQARQIWLRSIATTVIEPERLRNVTLVLMNEILELPAGDPANMDPDQLVHVLCAVVTRSGFSWQPVF